MGGTLPCAACRAEWKSHVAAHPPALGSRGALEAWMLGAHNAVNSRVGAPALTLEEARRRYTTASLGAVGAWGAAVAAVLAVILVVFGVWWVRRARQQASGGGGR